MIWNTFIFAITSRRRGLAAATIYGLSLAVRFTSATGEEVEIPPQSMQRSHPLISIMATDRTALPYQGWAPGSDCASARVADISDVDNVTAELPRLVAN